MCFTSLASTNYNSLGRNIGLHHIDITYGRAVQQVLGLLVYSGGLEDDVVTIVRGSRTMP